MKYFALKAESAGDFGINNKISDPAAKPVKVASLHYELDVWPTDDLLQVRGVHIISEPLAGSLQKLNPPVSGVSFDNVEVTTSAAFDHWHGQFGVDTYRDKAILPKFKWLNVSGRAGRDDFGLTPEALIVSVRVYYVMKSGNLKLCKVESIN